jgi:hypothetical protein
MSFIQPANTEMNPLMGKQRFEDLLLEAVDDAFSSLGTSCQKALYFHLEKTYNVKRNEIPYKLEEFADAIEKIFSVGASFLEIRIMTILYQKVGQIEHFLDREELVFTEYIAALRRMSRG